MLDDWRMRLIEVLNCCCWIVAVVELLLLLNCCCCWIVAVVELLLLLNCWCCCWIVVDVELLVLLLNCCWCWIVGVVVELLLMLNCWCCCWIVVDVVVVAVVVVAVIVASCCSLAYPCTEVSTSINSLFINLLLKWFLFYLFININIKKLENRDSNLIKNKIKLN